MGEEEEEWEQTKREWPTTWDDRAFWERRRQVKARGYPRGWTEHELEDIWVPDGKRVLGN